MFKQKPSQEVEATENALVVEMGERAETGERPANAEKQVRRNWTRHESAMMNFYIVIPALQLVALYVFAIWKISHLPVQRVTVVAIVGIVIATLMVLIMWGFWKRWLEPQLLVGKVHLWEEPTLIFAAMALLMVNIENYWYEAVLHMVVLIFSTEIVMGLFMATLVGSKYLEYRLRKCGVSFVEWCNLPKQES